MCPILCSVLFTTVFPAPAIVSALPTTGAQTLTDRHTYTHFLPLSLLSNQLTAQWPVFLQSSLGFQSHHHLQCVNPQTPNLFKSTVNFNVWTRYKKGRPAEELNKGARAAIKVDMGQAGRCVRGGTNAEFKKNLKSTLLLLILTKKELSYSSFIYATNNLPSIYYVPGNGPNTGHVE